MVKDVSDIRANAPEAIVHAAKVIGRSKDRRLIFEAIYRGKKKIKTTKEVAELFDHIESPQVRQIRVLNASKKLADNKIINRIRDQKTQKIALTKVDFYATNRDKVLGLVKNPKKIDKIPTKRNKGARAFIEIKIPIYQKARPIQITINDISSFKKTKSVNEKAAPKEEKLYENILKSLFQKLIGEQGTFNDWGGEKNDLYTTKVKLRGKRIASAIAFKGKGTKGKLTPKKMGKNADQIERLFSSPAQLFLIVYQGPIDQSIVAQMHAFALTKSYKGGNIYFGIIDEDDLNRIFIAYKGDLEQAKIDNK